MKTVYLIIGLLASAISFGQNVGARLTAAMKGLEGDAQFKHAILSMYVVDSKTGKLIYDKNSAVGLAPASCLKVVTSASAFELLGNEYTYKTAMKLYKASDSIRLFLFASGDPSFGSWRWEATNPDIILSNIRSALKKRNISMLGSDVTIIDNIFSYQPVPDGWLWQDIGNYYGAGARAFNWRENQYDLILSSGDNEGDPTAIQRFKPGSVDISITNYIKTGKKGSGDNAYIYTTPLSNSGYATGTIPPGQGNFAISGSIPNPGICFIKELKPLLNTGGITVKEGSNLYFLLAGRNADSFETIYTIVSPPLDSINYFFLKRSVNLYGEALVKTIAFEKTKLGSTDGGISIIKDLWINKGIESSALNIIDGSGLSPANRVTTNALVTIMQFAKDKSWFPSFYNALPELNGIKMKDGYINGVRSFTGYVKGKTGAEYTFSFIVNGYDGSAGTVREKMWKLLDILK